MELREGVVPTTDELVSLYRSVGWTAYAADPSALHAAVEVERRKRGKLFDEQLEAITALLTQDRTTFEGEHYRIEDMTLYPKPVQKPYPPIWMGGGVKSIWRAARYSEYLLCFWPNEEEVRTLWAPKLREEGEKYGTDPKLASFTFVYVAKDEQDFQSRLPLLRTAVAFENPEVDPLKVTLAGTPERCAERIRALFRDEADRMSTRLNSSHSSVSRMPSSA